MRCVIINGSPGVMFVDRYEIGAKLDPVTERRRTSFVHE